MEGEPTRLTPPRRRSSRRLEEIHGHIVSYLNEDNALKPSSYEKLARVLARVEGDLRSRRIHFADEVPVRAEIYVLKSRTQSF
jgi:hypothetical protein